MHRWLLLLRAAGDRSQSLPCVRMRLRLAVAPSPKPQVEVPPSISIEIAANAVIASVREFELQEASGSASPKGTAYLDGMRDAGYPLDLNNDLDTLVALKSLGVTPQYAKAMGAAGLGKPTARELITLKSMGVTPEYVAALKQSGIATEGLSRGGDRESAWRYTRICG